MSRTVGLLAMALLCPEPAWAEAGEIAVGVEGALALPGYSSTSPTAFALATWSVGAFGQYGIIDDLYLQGRFSFTTFHAESERVLEVSGRALPGTLRFETLQYHLEVGGRYKLYAGHDLAPYVETLIGYLWAGYQDQRFLTPDGRDYGLDLDDFGDGAFTISAGLAADYRLFNLIFIGAAVRFIYPIGAAVHRYQLVIPIQVSMFW
jgi:hypothetical protein